VSDRVRPKGERVLLSPSVLSYFREASLSEPEISKRKDEGKEGEGEGVRKEETERD
jgi:hypothetical protein